MELEVVIHRDSESKAYWAEVVQLPGCFAAGDTLPELEESLEEAIGLYLKDGDEGALLVSDRIESVKRYRLTRDRRLLAL